MITAGNWKMNMDLEKGLQLARAIKEGAPQNGALVIIAAPYIHLPSLAALLADSPHIGLAAQNCHQEEKGAFTGEVSVRMLLSVGVEYVILGHSERRQYFGETDELLALKVRRVLDSGLRPIFCCGESLDIRERGEHVAHVARQLRNSLFNLSKEAISKVILAYEPIWAIGTGVTASPEQAQQMHAEIRQLLRTQYGDSLAAQLPILYGGSVKAANAATLFSQPDVDGGLVGGASLKAPDFIQIAHACRQ